MLMYIWKHENICFISVHQPFTVISKPQYVTGRHGRQEVPPTPASADQYRCNIQALVHHNPVTNHNPRKNATVILTIIYIPITALFL